MKKREKKTEHLRFIFHKWLLILVLAAYVITFNAIFFIQKRYAEQYAASMLEHDLEYLSGQVTVYDGHRFMLKREAGKDLIAKAWAVSELIRSDPSFLNDRKAHEEIAGKLQLNAFYISDSSGMTVCSYPSKYEHQFSFANYETMRPYLKMITNKRYTIIEDPRPVDEDLKNNGEVVYQQFAGVPRLDRPGIVQVAYSSEQYDSLFKAVSEEHLFDGYTIGHTGFALLIEDGKILSATHDDMKSLSVQSIMNHTASRIYTITYEGKRCMACTKVYNKVHLVAAVPYAEIYSTMRSLLIWTAVFFCILFTIVFFQVSNLLDKVVVRNINKTNETLTKITNGDLEEHVDILSNQEFESLSNGINMTVAALKKSMAEAAARIDRELEFAHAIQMSALPNLCPPYQGNSRYDLAADMHPAKEVGGDFYDFFMVDGRRLGIVIADVSGKGIPAALFMMTAKAQIRNHMQSDMKLSDACMEINKALCEGNDAQMFVTVFVGVLDPDTGLLTYVNAGHNPPLVSHEGVFNYVHNRSGLFMGSFDTAKYKEYTLQLEKGDTFFLYTDGITEAMDVYGKLYGEDRLKGHLDKCARYTPHMVMESVYGAVAEYAGAAPQADDMTMLILQYNPDARSRDSHEFKAALDQLEAVQSFIGEPLEKRGCPASVRRQLAVAVEELFVNIAVHAYEGAYGHGTAEVSWVCTDDPRAISVTFKDSGVPFNPLEHADPQRPESVQKAQIGGLGILMARKNTDSMQYSYEDGKNVLTFTKNW